MNNELDQFETVARRRLDQELSRVPIPQRSFRRIETTRRGRPAGGLRLVGLTAVVAILVLGGMFAVASIESPPSTANQPTAVSGPSQPEQLYLFGSDMQDSSDPCDVIMAVDQSTYASRYSFSIPQPDCSSNAVLSPDGSRLYTVDGSLTIYAYKTGTGELLWNATASESGHTDVLPVLAISPDGRTLAIIKNGFEMNNTYSWALIDAHTGKTSQSASFQGDYAASPNEGIPAWRRRLPAREYTAAYGETTLLSPDNQTMYTISRLGLHTVDLVNPSIVKTADDLFTGYAALSPDGSAIYATVFITSTNSLSLGLLKLETASGNRSMIELDLHADSLGEGNLVKVTPDGAHIIVSLIPRDTPPTARETELLVIDTATQREVRRIKVDAPLVADSAALSRDGKTLYAISEDSFQDLLSFDLTTGTLLATTNYPNGSFRQALVGLLPKEIATAPTMTPGSLPLPPPPSTPTPVEPSEPPFETPSGRMYVVSAIRDEKGVTTGSQLTGFDLSSREAVYTTNGGLDALLSPDGSWLYVLGNDHLQAREAITGAALWTVPITNVMRYEDTGPPIMAISPDGKRLYVQSATVKDSKESYWIQIVDMERGAVLPDTIPLPQFAGVARIGITPDNSFLYHAADGKLRFINLQTRQIEHELDRGRDMELIPSADGRLMHIIRKGPEALTGHDAIDLTTRNSVTMPSLAQKLTGPDAFYIYNYQAAASNSLLAVEGINPATGEQQVIWNNLGQSVDSGNEIGPAPGDQSRKPAPRFTLTVGADNRSLYTVDRHKAADSDLTTDTILWRDLMGSGQIAYNLTAGEAVRRILIGPDQPRQSPPPPSTPPPPTALPTAPMQLPPTAQPTVPAPAESLSFSGTITQGYPADKPTNQAASCIRGQVLVDGTPVAAAVGNVNDGSSEQQWLTNAKGEFTVCGLAWTNWSVVLFYIPGPALLQDAAVIPGVWLNGSAEQQATVIFQGR